MLETPDTDTDTEWQRQEAAVAAHRRGHIDPHDPYQLIHRALARTRGSEVPADFAPGVLARVARQQQARPAFEWALLGWSAAGLLAAAWLAWMLNPDLVASVHSRGLNVQPPGQALWLLWLGLALALTASLPFPRAQTTPTPTPTPAPHPTP